MTDQEGHAVSLDTNLSRSRDRQVGLRWPTAVDARLDLLLAAAIDAGERTNRKELLAALVAGCDLDGPALGQALRAYRTMRVRDALPPQPRGAVVAYFADGKPGPRTAVN